MKKEIIGDDYCEACDCYECECDKYKVVTTKKVTTVKEVELTAKEVLVEFIKNNYLDDDGNIYIADLDFGDFEGILMLDGIKTNGIISQCRHVAKGTIYQSNNIKKLQNKLIL